MADMTETNHSGNNAFIYQCFIVAGWWCQIIVQRQRPSFNNLIWFNIHHQTPYLFFFTFLFPILTIEGLSSTPRFRWFTKGRSWWGRTSPLTPCHYGQKTLKVAPFTWPPSPLTSSGWAGSTLQHKCLCNTSRPNHNSKRVIIVCT